MEPIHSANASWREYQNRLQRSASQKSALKTVLKYFLLVPALLSLFYAVDRRIGDATGNADWEKVAAGTEKPRTAKTPDPQLLTKDEVRTLLGTTHLANLKEKEFDLDLDGKKLRIETSLDMSLQEYIQQKLNPATARYIAVVVMDPVTGKVLSMAGYDKNAPESNPCVDDSFPAASIFKIVTASAAIEKLNMNPDSEFTYNGRKHTLYRSQLREKNNKWTNRITLEDSFAQSVNPVFGKLGANYLGGAVLAQYAEAFGFDRRVEFEIPVAASTAPCTNEPYQWAELASGFNHKTTMSPLHGALLAAAILNQGKLMEPSIVDQITDETGHTLYSSRPHTVQQAISPWASEKMGSLMEATIRSGTASHIFRGYRRDRVLSKLHIGGKTGSIDNKDGSARFDWFVGFAEEINGEQKIVISAVVAHEKYIGVRAAEYARMAIKQYFKEYFTRNKSSQERERRS